MFFTMRRHVRVAVIITTAFSSFIGMSANIQKLCSVVREGFWGIGTSVDAGDACENAINELFDNVRAGGQIAEVTPPFQVYIQSYFFEDSVNHVIVSCDNDGNKVEGTFEGRGVDPIRKGKHWAFGENLFSACRMSVSENLNHPDHPVRKGELLGYCHYGDLNNKSVLKFSNLGFGRDAACKGARSDYGNNEITFRSAGYFHVKGQTALNFSMPPSTADFVSFNLAVVQSLDSFKQLRAKYLQRVGLTGYVVTSSAFSSFGVGSDPEFDITAPDFGFVVDAVP